MFTGKFNKTVPCRLVTQYIEMLQRVGHVKKLG